MKFLERGRRNTLTEPFPIRGHHLRNYQELLVKGYTPEEQAHATRVANFPFRFANLFMDEQSRKKHEDDMHDTYGDTEESADRVEASHKEVFRRFLDLKNNAPVEISEGRKDGICKCCNVGNHCLQKNVFEGDQLFVDLFLQLAPRRRVKIQETIVNFSDFQAQPARVVTTTVKTIKKVIKNERFRL